jgi:hypothetical protein
LLLITLADLLFERPHEIFQVLILLIFGHLEIVRYALNLATQIRLLLHLGLENVLVFFRHLVEFFFQMADLLMGELKTA